MAWDWTITLRAPHLAPAQHYIIVKPIWWRRGARAGCAYERVNEHLVPLGALTVGLANIRHFKFRTVFEAAMVCRCRTRFIVGVSGCHARCWVHCAPPPAPFEPRRVTDRGCRMRMRGPHAGSAAQTNTVRIHCQQRTDATSKYHPCAIFTPVQSYIHLTTSDHTTHASMQALPRPTPLPLQSPAAGRYRITPNPRGPRNLEFSSRSTATSARSDSLSTRSSASSARISCLCESSSRIISM